MGTNPSQNTAIRCFIALDISRNIEAKLASVQNRLKQAGAQARWVPAHNLHITLRFLGSRRPKRVKQTAAALSGMFTQNPEFKITINSLAAFPDLNHPRVIWTGISEGTPAILQLFNQLNDGLAALGIPKDHDPFIPHITLARCRNAAEMTSTAESIKKVLIKPIRTSISCLTFYQSTLGAQGVSYNPITSIRLQS